MNGSPLEETYGNKIKNRMAIEVIPIVDMPSFLGHLQDVSSQIVKLLGWIVSMLFLGLVKFATEKK